MNAEQIKKACGYVLDPLGVANCRNCKHSVTTPERIICFKHCGKYGGLRVEWLGKCRDHEKIGEQKIEDPKAAIKMTSEQSRQAKRACNYMSIADIKAGQLRQEKREKTCENCLSIVFDVPCSECSKHGFPVSWSAVCDDWTMKDVKNESTNSWSEGRDDRKTKDVKKDVKNKSTNDTHIKAHEDNIIHHAEALSDYIARGPGRKLVDDTAYEHAWQIRRSLDHIKLRRS